MSTLTTAPRRTTTRPATFGAVLLTIGCLVLAYMDFFGHTSGSAAAFKTTDDYVYTAAGFPFIIGLLLLLAGVRAANRGRDGLLGTIGFVGATTGSLAVLVCLVASLLTRSENALGPVYVLGSLTSVISVLIFAAGTIKARVLPWWSAVALAITWIIGGLVGDGGPLGFNGSALLLAAAAITIALLCSRTTADGKA